MKKPELNIITGAFGFTGRYITRRLLSMGKEIRTITGHPGTVNIFGDRVGVFPFNFDNPGELVKSMQGADTLYNTYWVRFPHGNINYDVAVENTGTMIRAAVEAGVRRIVHISIANASGESSFPYFRGKGIIEKEIADSGLSYAIIRPTVIFGEGDILINNIAWLLRRFPVFAIPGSGDYRLQPVYVEDLAGMAVDLAQRDDNVIVDAVGPEIFTFKELARLIAEKVHSRSLFIHLNPGLTYFLSRIIGLAVKDVVLTEAEVSGLMENLLISADPPTGIRRLSDWLSENASLVGTKYASELNRHYR
ncbi:MAG: NAD(P)H-binding protein [Actinobacteria bacterium]|nr:NAD(P)H-binding protein [Actinomycetota bacterium]